MKDTLILGIESSCDETAASVVKNGRTVLSNVISSQIEIHKLYGGVVPEIASRNHIERINQVIQEALDEANVTLNDIDAIGVTYGPGLVGALLVGVAEAKAIAYARNLPLVGVHHIEGHVSANYIEHPDLEPPFLCAIVSGGHTHLVIVKDYGQFEILGRTRDDAAGEAFDKVGRVMGMKYPSGKEIDELAKTGKDTFNFPRAMEKEDNFDFSFSGLKSAFINTVHHASQIGEKLDKADLATSFEQSVVDVLSSKTVKALEHFKVKQLILAGGVAANQGLRTRLDKELTAFKDVELLKAPLKLCGDNAAMIGAAGYVAFKHGVRADMTLNAEPSLEFEWMVEK